MTTNDAPVLRQNVRWGEEYVSRGLNAKLAGIISPGVYHGFVLKPGGMMAVLVDHEPDYPRSVAVVERDGYSLTVVMDDPGRVHIPATGTWFVCIEAFYSPTQQGYQRIVVRETPEAHHIVLGKVRAGVPLTEPEEPEPGNNGEESEVPSPAPGVAVVITQEMISAGEPKVDADNATLDDLTASIKAHDESVAAHGFDDPKSPLRKAIAAEATAAVNEKIGIEEGQINLLAHASTHAQDGVDPITPESIGAASENDPRITSAITPSRLGPGLHMEEVGEGDDTQTLLAADRATQEAPGLMQPDGVTVTVDEAGLLSALGGNLLLNSEEWITESGTWVAPLSGWYQLLLMGGGWGGVADSTRGARGGRSGSLFSALAWLEAGAEIPVTIGAGGPGQTVANMDDASAGGVTTFGDLTSEDAAKIMETAGLACDAAELCFKGNQMRTIANAQTAGAWPTAHGGGFGGGYGAGTVGSPPLAGFHGQFFGAGGAAKYHATASDLRVGNGCQGAVWVRWHDPAKAAGPVPAPALLSARRMVSRAVAEPVVVNLYDPATGQGSVWREEDAEARLAEGLITEAAWLEICAARAAEERAAWLADPETCAERFELLRMARDARLAATDYLVAPDYPLTDEQRATVTAYRQALCDLPAQEGAPWDGGGELTPWPEMPTLKMNTGTE